MDQNRVEKALRDIGGAFLELADALGSPASRADELPPVLTLDDFATYARICPDSAREVCGRGEVRGAFQQSPRGRWKIPRDGAQEYVASRGAKPQREAPRVAPQAPKAQRPLKVVRGDGVRDYVADLRKKEAA